VTSIPSNLPSYSRDPNAPQPVAAVNNNTNIYARNPNAPRVPVLQSPYLAGEASRPQQYANQNNQGRNPDGSFAGAAGSGAGVGAGGPGSRGPYQKKGPGPFAVPRESIRTRRDETGGREEGESELTESYSSSRFLSSTVRQMMFGFGDEPEPPEDTVAVMEDLLGHFVQELVSPEGGGGGPELRIGRACLHLESRFLHVFVKVEN